MSQLIQLDTFVCIEMAIYDSSGLTGSYQVLNGAANQTGTSSVGFQYDIKILKIYNDGTTAVTLSYDGVVNHDYLPSKGTMIIDLQTNHRDNGSSGSGQLYGRQGQLVWGKGTAGTNNIYISGYL